MTNVIQYLRRNLGDGDFESAALDVLRTQAKEIAPYRRMLETYPGREFLKWSDYPAIPVSSFRTEALCPHAPEKAAIHFETSGTTSSETGHHYMLTGKYYEQALVEGFRMSLPPLSGHRWLSLIPPLSEKPHSSLSFMIDRLVASEVPKSVSYFCDKNYSLDFDQLIPELSRQPSSPVSLFGTSFAWASFLEKIGGEKFQIHPDSILFDTGGFKKSATLLTQQELWQKLSGSLTLGLKNIWNEYGMTELSSQCYATAAEGIHRPPPWLKVRIIHPATGQLCTEGERGLIHFYDLANVESVMAIATLDTGCYVKDGFRLMGRLQGAAARGCSLPYQP